MKVAGNAVVNAPVEVVWDALLDPQVLVQTIPGCEVLEATGENAYAMTVSAGVAAIRGTYAGTCTLSDLVPGTSLVMRAEGAGSPGTIAADVAVRFTDTGEGTTAIAYDADAIVGGMIGGVGQRMLTAVGKRMAGEFFDAVSSVIESGGAPVVDEDEVVEAALGGGDAAQAGAATAGPLTARRPASGGRTASGSFGDVLRGALLGGGLVLAGVVVGGLLGRRAR